MRNGLWDAGIERLHEVAVAHLGDDRVPGMVVLVAHGEDVHAEALGRLAVGAAGAPVARDSLFRISSTTKPLTAAATLALVDEGLIALDEPVDELLPELARRRVRARIDGPLELTVPAHRPITPRDLLTFTFGFGMAVGVPFSEVLRTRVLDPLEMRDTAFWTAATDRLAIAYFPTPNGLVVHDRAE